MNKTGPIVVIEDDLDDQELIEPILKALVDNDILFFDDGYAALKYLESTEVSPFLVISDINLPKLNGFELREKLHNNEAIKLKCIPYLFFTTASARIAVRDAYSKSAQGFFVKPSSIGALESMMKTIVEYWQLCEAPTE